MMKKNHSEFLNNMFENVGILFFYLLIIAAVQFLGPIRSHGVDDFSGK